MNAVRYFSRSGNTKIVAEAMADALKVNAVSVDDAGAAIKEDTDVLFIGGALYAYGIDKQLQSYIDGLDASKVKKAAVFSTSWLSRHALDLIKKGLEKKGISVVDETFYVKNKANAKQLQEAAAFARKYAK